MDTLNDIEALVFDVFGTVVDWRGSVTEQLKDKLVTEGDALDLDAFAMEWRNGYGFHTHRISQGGDGPASVDILHREILDSMLESPRWSFLASRCTDEKRRDLNLVWHHLRGWPDATEGLYALKKQMLIATLSNGNVRLLVDMAKYADLPWDMIFAGELMGSYKPNSKMYLGAAHHLSLPPSRCAMVAAHIHDLRAAASCGLKTIYVRRPAEDEGLKDSVKSKADGGEVDLVVDSFLELATILEGHRLPGRATAQPRS